MIDGRLFVGRQKKIILVALQDLAQISHGLTEALVGEQLLGVGQFLQRGADCATGEDIFVGLILVLAGIGVGDRRGPRHTGLSGHIGRERPRGRDGQRKHGPGMRSFQPAATA